MANVRIAFDKIEGVTPDEVGKVRTRPGYEHINMHMIFYIDMYGEFTRNARLVANVHTTAPLS